MNVQAPDFSRIVGDAATYMEELLWIRDKAGTVRPFRLNAIQRAIRARKAEVRKDRRKPSRFLVLKPRRVGVTTLEQAESFYAVATRPSYHATTLAHSDEAVEKIFRIAQLFYDRLAEEFRPARLTLSNKRDLNFNKLRSLFSIGTAGARGFSRGDTLNKVHWSEVAWSPGDKEQQRRLLAGLTEAASEGEVTLETTPNGVGDLFHEKFKEAVEGANEWTPMFFPWWTDPGNRLALAPGEAEEVTRTLTDEEGKLAARHGLDPAQIAWRRSQKRELKSLFLQEYPEDWETCFLVSGACFFDKPKLNDLFKHCPDALRTELNGELTVWEEPLPGRKYVAAGDVAEGVAGGNRSVLGILDVESGKQVAVLRGRWSPDEFGRLCARLGKHYNWALIAIERNNHGHSVLNTLVNECEYPELYYHTEYDASGKGTPVLGWPTSAKTRPILLDELRTAVEDRHMIVRDRGLLDECRTFGPDRNGKYKGLNGAKDDSVLTWGIAWQVRQRSHRRDEGTKVPSNLTAMVRPAASARIFGDLPRERATTVLPRVGGGAMPGRIF